MSGYNYGPSENELVLNVTSQLLREMASRYPASTALAPTRRKENVLGYDVDVRELLGVVLQFKRPSEIRARTHPTRLPKPTSTATPVRFKTNLEQWITLISGFNLGEAFYALPPVLDGADLYRALKQTIFVDVYGVLPKTSLLYTVPDGCSYSGGQPLVEGKIKNGSTYQVPPAFVYCFDDIRTGLSSSLLGLQLYEAIDPHGRFDPEQPLKEQRRATEELAEFKSRLDMLSSTNTELAEHRVRDALQNAMRSLQELSNLDFRSDILGQVRVKLANTNDFSATERWKHIFVSTNQNAPYEADTVASACDDIEEITASAFHNLRDDLISDSDIPPATQLLQHADSEMCMLGRQ